MYYVLCMRVCVCMNVYTPQQPRRSPNAVCFVLLNWSDCQDCRCVPFDIFALVCFLIREQFSRLRSVQKAFELSGSISIAPTGSAWR
jgi:hypothetical protein